MKRGRFFVNAAPQRAALHDQRGFGDLPDPPQRFAGVLAAAGDVELLLGPDDEVGERNDFLKLSRNVLRGDEALLSHAGGSQTPQHRTVVDVEDELFRLLDGRKARLGGLRLREMRARDEERMRRADEGGVEIPRAHRHVGAVVAVEDEREGVAVLDGEEYERGKPPRIGGDVRYVDALGGKRLAHEAAVMLVADARQHRYLQPEAARAHRNVRRAAAEVLGEARLILEPRADLLAVEVERRA